MVYSAGDTDATDKRRVPKNFDGDVDEWGKRGSLSALSKVASWFTTIIQHAT
ncbi:hypothetical protein [Pectinatus frisingensis]|uniref:hypothetical protein n=1 Tax=Pectinatus frisingensis TaxID=865 RepID=UPI003D809310